jgi:hypothetical protein
VGADNAVFKVEYRGAASVGKDELASAQAGIGDGKHAPLW